MSSPVSDSLEGAYHKLHPTIRRWIRDQGWDELREIQARTILSIIGGDRDIVIAATTAAGPAIMPAACTAGMSDAAAEASFCPASAPN